MGRMARGRRSDPGAALAAVARLLLALALGLAQGAHAGAAPGGMMVICSASGGYTVPMPGAPVDGADNAPLCCLAACAAAMPVLPPAPAPPPLRGFMAQRPGAAVADAAVPARGAHRARAPPAGG